MTILYLKALKYAIKVHTDNNQKYDGQPYVLHLMCCLDVAFRFIHLIPPNKRYEVLSGVMLHDAIEDGNVSYNDIKNETNEYVAELSYALTNEKGRNRSERANDNYYKGIKNIENATFIKLCDRIANMEYSINSNNRMGELYVKEYKHFKNMLYDLKYIEMFNHIEHLIQMNNISA